jgi:hypothetical protein
VAYPGRDAGWFLFYFYLFVRRGQQPPGLYDKSREELLSFFLYGYNLLWLLRQGVMELGKRTEGHAQRIFESSSVW